MTTALLERPVISDAEVARILDDISRRGLLAGTIGTTALFGLAGCGSSGSDAGSPPSPSATARSVSTIHGQVSVPSTPKRIVAANFPEACTLLDLGITPVGRPAYMPSFAKYLRALGGVPMVTDSAGQLLLERIASLTPDLIVTADWADPKMQQVPYDKLRAIAPTAVFAWQQAAGNWRDQATATAGAVNQAEALAALRRKYLDRAAEIGRTHARLLAETRWDVIDASQNVWDLYSSASSHGGVLTEAGVRLSAAQNQTRGYQEYSFERLDVLASSDVILTTPVSLPFLRKQAAFNRLPAARAGHVYSTDLFFPASFGVASGLLDDLASICAKLTTD